MSVTRRVTIASVMKRVILLAGLMFVTAHCVTAEMPAGTQSTARDKSRPAPVCEPSSLDSPYILVDSWVYPAMMRLYGLGFVDTIYLGMRPWTRASLENMLEEVGARIEDAQDDSNQASDEAQHIYEALNRERH